MVKKRSSISIDERDDRRIKAAAAMLGVDVSTFVVTAALERAERLERTAAHRAEFDEYVRSVFRERGEDVQLPSTDTSAPLTDEDRLAAHRVSAGSFVAGNRRSVT